MKSKKEEVVAMRETFLELKRLKEGEGVLGYSERVRGFVGSWKRHRTNTCILERNTCERVR